MMTETSFATEVLKWAKVYRWRAFHVRNSGYKGQAFVQGDKGFPDLVLVKPPRLIFAELKVGKNKPTGDQLVWMQCFEDCVPHGAIRSAIETYAWKPENWSQILAVLSRP